MHYLFEIQNGFGLQLFITFLDIQNSKKSSHPVDLQPNNEKSLC